MRKSVDKTWRFLKAEGLEMPRAANGGPYIPSQMPSYDDPEPLGFSFFREGWEDARFDELALPRTYFGRSLLERVSFRDTDLSESRMCWNDFIDCDFSSADLRRCDLRASLFRRCVFRNADLSEADLRRSSFEACIFDHAKMRGAIAHRPSAAEDLVPLLVKPQLDEIRWVPEAGEEPPGG